MANEGVFSHLVDEVLESGDTGAESLSGSSVFTRISSLRLSLCLSARRLFIWILILNLVEADTHGLESNFRIYFPILGVGCS